MMILFSVRMPKIKVLFVIVENTYEITFVIMRSTIAQDYFVCCCNYGTGLVLLPHSIRSSELWCLFSQWSIHHSWESRRELFFKKLESSMTLRLIPEDAPRSSPSFFICSTKGNHSPRSAFNFCFVLQMHGNSFQRKLRIVKNGGTPVAEVMTLLMLFLLIDSSSENVFLFISSVVSLMSRSRNGELQLLIVDEPAFLTSPSSGREACRLVQRGFA